MASSRSERWRTAAALLLLAAYALPLFVPPAATPLTPLAFDASLGERLFPGVPGWWVAARLLCLLVAALLIASVGRARVSPSSSAPQGEGADASVSQPFMWAAMWLAALQVVAGFWASHFSRVAQLVYVAWFAIPPLVLAVGRKRAPAPHRGDWRVPAMVAAVVVAWLLLRFPVIWRSPRAADLIDTWIGLQHLRRAADQTFNLLTDRFLAGGGSLYLMFQGAGFVHWAGLAPSFQLAQAAQLFWLALAGTTLGLAAARLVGTTAAPVATAAFLFSPFVQMMLLTPLALFFGPLMAAGLVLLLVKVHENRSAPALAALGALAGMTATQPSTALTAVAILGGAVWSARQRPRLLTHAVIVAGLLFAAGVVTGLPSVETLRSMGQTYTRGRAQWVGHEMAGFGQVTAASEYLAEGATPRSLDTPLSAVLAPFALPRTPMRLLGDALFDPIGGALGAVGIAVCLAAAASLRTRALLGLFAVALLPGFLSSADRISIIRLFVVPVPMALLAAVGFETVRRGLGPTRPAIASGVVAAAIAVGGIVLFDVVNPRILASSWETIILQSLGGEPLERAVVFDHPIPDSFPYWYLREITEAISSQPIAVQAFSQDQTDWWADSGGEVPADLVFWNPGLEEDHQVSGAICQRWPDAALYTLTDLAGQSRAFAARPGGARWTPALPEAQWNVQQECSTVLETESTWAVEVMADADDLVADDRQDEAANLLRAAARQTFAQADLFAATANALLESFPTGEAKLEALHWARRACLVTRFREPSALAALAAAYAAVGQLNEALDTARQAKELAVAQGNQDLMTKLEGRIREYERAASAGPPP